MLPTFFREESHSDRLLYSIATKVLSWGLQIQLGKQRTPPPELPWLGFRASAFTRLIQNRSGHSHSLTLASCYFRALRFFFFFQITQFHFITNIGELIYCLIKKKSHANYTVIFPRSVPPPPTPWPGCWSISSLLGTRSNENHLYIYFKSLCWV